MKTQKAHSEMYRVPSAIKYVQKLPLLTEYEQDSKESHALVGNAFRHLVFLNCAMFCWPYG